MWTYRDVAPLLALNERIFRFCLQDIDGSRVAARTGIDPFEAVRVDDRMPEQFRSRRYPQMRDALERARQKRNSPS